MTISKKWASVFANPKLVCVLTRSGLRRAAYDPLGSCEVFLRENADAATLGRAVFEALAKSRVLTDDSELGEFFDRDALKRRYDEWVKILVKQYGYDSRRALFKSMEMCEVEEQEGRVKVFKYIHRELESWDLVSEKDCLIAAATAGDDAIGAAVLQQLGN